MCVCCCPQVAVYYEIVKWFQPRFTLMEQVLVGDVRTAPLPAVMRFI